MIIFFVFLNSCINRFCFGSVKTVNLVKSTIFLKTAWIMK